MTRHSFLAFIAAVAVVLGGCNSKSVDTGDPSHPKANDVFLEAMNAPGAKPFMHSVAVAPVPPVGGPRGAAARATGGGSVRGTTPGLYGGLRSQSPCDAMSGVDALSGDDARAQQWVSALNSDPDLSWSGGSKLSTADISTYVTELTSVFLQTDTRVTDRGRNAPAFQAVLERGSAVMIDRQGVPRVRCASFSPLVPPKTASSPKYRGAPWDGFESGKLAVIAPGAEVEAFRVVDVHTHRLFDLPAGQQLLSTTTTTSSTTSTTTAGDDTSTTLRRTTTTTTLKRVTTTTAHTATTTPVTAAPTTTTPPAPTTTAG